MEERNIREYVAAAYFIACDMKHDERALEHLASDVSDRRYKNRIPVEVVKKDLLHYLFLYVFFQSKRRTKDRATQYAQGLKQYFYEDRPPVEVADIIVKYGPDKLRRVAQRRTQLIEGAQEWAKIGKDPRSPSFDEVLAELLEEEKKAKSTAEEELPDTDGRALPPDGSDNEISDADWIAELKADAEKAENEDPSGTADDEDSESDTTADDDESQYPEIDEFYKTTLQITAQIVDGLTDEALTREKRKDLAVLAIQLANRILLHRKPFI